LIPSIPFIIPNFSEKLYSEEFALAPFRDWSKVVEEVYDDNGKLKIEIEREVR